MERRGYHGHFDFLDGFRGYQVRIDLKKTDDLLNEDTQRCFHEAFLAGAGSKPAPTRYVFLNQVHGDNVQVLEDENQLSRGTPCGRPIGLGGDKPRPYLFHHLANTDGVITNIEDLTLLVMTADCLSIFLCAKSSVGAGFEPAPTWIGLVHAGWRGTQKMIVKKAFETIQERSGCGAADIHVILGPRIGKDHYEVGVEFQQYFPVEVRSPRPFLGGVTPSLHQKKNKWYFDLAGANKRQLLDAGALRSRIVDLELCTLSEIEDFYSFRKEKEAAGRIISFISKF